MKKNLKNIKKKYEATIEESSVEKVERKIELSNGDYEGSLDMKRVYTKTLEKIYLMNQEPRNALIFAAYDFNKENDEWKLAMIKDSYIPLNEFNKTQLEEVLSRTAFSPENNNEIEYIESINLTSE